MKIPKLNIIFAALIFSMSCMQAQTPTPTPAAEAPVKPAATGLRLPSIISDHMVLQRDMKTPIWGWAEPGEAITVTAGGVTAKATAAAAGKWMTKLEGLKASPTPIQVTVAGKSNTLTINDVLIGDAWICSGQSNMVFPLGADHSAKDEVPIANYPLIRLFVMTKNNAAPEPQSDCDGHWVVCTPATAGSFSGVGYFFGKEIEETEHVPVGLIQSSFGGTIAEAWTSLDALQANPIISKALRLENYPALRDMVVANIAKHDAWHDAVGKEYDPLVQQWARACQEAKQKGEPLPPKPVPSQPEPPHQVMERLPGSLFNGMIAPLVPFGIKGVIWYQGESNRGGGELYRTLFPTLIADWRQHFGQGDFPFIFVQLANNETTAPPNSIYGYPPLREAQLMTLTASPNTGMAVAIDLGNPTNIHPTDKRDVGHRLALVARHLAYGEQLVYSGPIYDSIKTDGDKIHVKFKEVGGGLKIGTAPPEQLEMFPALPTTSLTGFSIAGDDMKFVPATAVIEGTDNVVVSSDQVKNPVAVRYDWDDSPVGNLYNHEDLAASPFRTDSFPLSTERPDHPTGAPARADNSASESSTNTAPRAPAAPRTMDSSTNAAPRAPAAPRATSSSTNAAPRAPAPPRTTDSSTNADNPRAPIP